jgi:glucose/arabinose dehydrogenase
MILLTLLAAAASAGPFSDFRAQKPGVRHRITVSDLPAPDPAQDVNNGPSLVDRPEGAWPVAPKGFVVELFATGFDNPREIRTAPNGDVFIAESGPGRIKIARGLSKDGKPDRVEVFASGLNKPYGIAFWPPGPEPKFVYVGDTDAVLRFPYKSGDLKAAGKSETVLKLPGGGLLEGGMGGHWTRGVAFSPDGKRMFVSVGSKSNVSDGASERMRADILVATPEGKDLRVYAAGLRNPASIAVQPGTGAVWASVNERDRLGDNLPPDYITSVKEGGFYGWPWFYIGGHQDPRHEGKHPELKDKVLVPDVLIQPHNASLGLTFYEGAQFPAEYRGDLFAAEHGSWNRSQRTGYEIIRVFLKDGRATGAYEDFVTGFVTPEGQVWGRPVGVTVASDGSLIFSDDASGSLWRVRRSAPKP